VAEKLYAGSRSRRLAENFAPFHIYCLSIFSLGNTRTPWSDAPKFGTVFIAFIVDGRYIFVCRYVEPF